MAPTIVVTGVPGVGASRACEEARRILGDRVTLVNVGDVMLEEALERGLAESRAALAELPLRDQRLLQRRAGERLASRASDGPLVVNTHLVVHTPHGFVQGLPEVVRRDLDPAAFVVVDAPIQTIVYRRQSSERSYANQVTTAIRFHRELQNAAAMTYSAAANAPIRYVSSEESAEDAGEDLATTVEDVIGP